MGSRLPGSGFTRVLESLLPDLGRYWEIHWIGTGYKDEIRDLDGYRLYPSNLEGGDVFGAYQAARLSRELGAAAVLVLNDLWMLTAYVPALVTDGPGVPVVGYCPLDGCIRDDGFCRTVQGFDAIVTYTVFGLTELQSAYDRLHHQGELTRQPLLRIAGHGVDSSVFRQLPEAERAAWRIRLFGDASPPEGAVLVLNANRPVPRKRVDISIEGFACAVRRSSHPLYLCLHQALATGDETDELRNRIRSLGIEDRVLFTAGTMDEETLNGLYNACQIGLNTAMGEGWGLVSFEHAATGAAQIVPRHSACAELWSDAALLLEPTRRYVPEFSPLEMAEVTAKDVGTAIERLAHEPELRAGLGAAGYRRATGRDYRWETLAEHWNQLLRAVVT